jgi:hypothetical protein
MPQRQQMILFSWKTEKNKFTADQNLKFHSYENPSA